MKITILGSGGFQPIPKPGCNCKICKEALKKGKPPFVRRGPALFIHGQNILIDTPEDIVENLRYHSIKKVEKVMYTHWHPNHVAGFRIFEQMNGTWKKDKVKGDYVFEGAKKTPVYAPSEILHDIRNIISPTGSYLDFFIKKKYLELKEMGYYKDYTFGNFKITAFPHPENSKTNVCSYLLEQKGKKVLYAACDVKPWQDHKQINNLDMLIICSPWFEKLPRGLKVTKKHPLRERMFSMEETLELIDKYNVKKTVFMHIEEMWQMSPKDYKKIETKYKKYGIEFAYDGLTLSV